MKRILIIIARIAFIVLAFTLVFRKIKAEALLSHIMQANMLLVFLALLLQNGSLMCSALRSRYYFHSYGLKVRKRFAIAYYYVGTLFNTILPGGISGDGYKIYLLWKLEKFPKLLGLRIMLYERVSGFYVLVFMGLLALLASSYIELFPYELPLTIACIIFITPCYLFGVKYVMRDKIAIAWGASYYSFFVQLLQVTSALVLVKALIAEPTMQQYIDYIVLFIAASIAAIIPISVGGAGLRELTFLYGIQLMPISDVETGVAFAMINFFLYLLTAIPGILLFYKIDKIKRVK